MNPIDPDAVIDAIARLFPDGFDYYDRSGNWPETLLDDIGYDEPCAGFGKLCGVIDSLTADGRLRDTKSGLRALSHTEHAWRIVAMWYGLDFDAEQDALDIERVANVLAGKTEKKA